MYELYHTSFITQNYPTVYYNFLEDENVACYSKESGFYNVDIYIFSDLQYDKCLEDCLIC